MSHNKKTQTCLPAGRNKIFIISGPSGVGKTSVARRIIRKFPNLKTSVTYSTRTKRLGKKEDKTIIHVSEDEFRKKLDNGDFLEWAVVHEKLYGTDAKTIRETLKKSNILMNIDVQGALQIKKKMPKQTILIFLKANSIDELKNRINSREKMAKAILELRMKNAKKELALAKKYDYVVINKEHRLKETIDEVSEIINKNT